MPEPCETDATPLLASVRAARRLGDVRECERLAGECLRVAEAVRDAEAGFHACTAPGMLRLSRAEPQEAREWFGAALVVVESADLWRWKGAAYHNAFIAARDARGYGAAGRYAGAAFEAYADAWQGNRIPALTADVNEGILTACPSLDRASTAFSCWKHTAFNTRTPRERIICAVNGMGSASILYAFGPREARDTYRRRFFWFADDLQRELNLANAADECEDVARCLVEASVASCRIGDFERASAVAGNAIKIALARGETTVAQAAGEARICARAERYPPALWS